MLSKRTHPMIGKISELLIGVNRSAAAPFLDVLMMTSPRSPLDFKSFPQRNSSKRLFNDNLGPSVGLGIVAALDNSNTRQITRFESSTSKEEEEEEEEEEEMFAMDEDDNYTLTNHDRDGFKSLPTKIENDKNILFMVDIDMDYPESSPEFRGLSFLSSCYLCRKKLHGQDIYIYRGEKAFCSTECRSSYIAKDEKKERCNSNFSASPYAGGQIFTTGVLVT